METLNDLLGRWHAWGDRDLWRKVLANRDAKPDSRALAEKRLPELESATGLDALAANVRLVELMKGWQWLAIKSAREDGATWDQVGQVLGTSKQGAQTPTAGPSRTRRHTRQICTTRPRPGPSSAPRTRTSA